MLNTQMWPCISLLLLIVFAGKCGLADALLPTGITACELRPLGHGLDDTTQIEAAILRCGNGGTTNFAEGVYNITRKMHWDLVSATVNLHGTLSFYPDIEYWMDPNNTDRAVIIQNQASWFVVSGNDFKIDAHGSGGIDGNGQPWWSYFATRTRLDGDGRPVSLSLVNVTRALVSNFSINAPPFWCTTVTNVQDVVFNGMNCNATNSDPLFIRQNIVPNTDGICTFRSDNVTLVNWDVTCGDDCLAIKGNSSNIHASNIKCRGGNGIAFGSLGQYGPAEPDFVHNVVLENIEMIRIDPAIQPNMKKGVYFKTWTGTINGLPPVGGGGGGGRVSNVTIRNVHLHRVDLPIQLYQTNNGRSGDQLSKLTFDDLNFSNWSGVSTGSTFVDVRCATLCQGLHFEGLDITPPAGQTPRFICINATDATGLPQCTRP